MIQTAIANVVGPPIAADNPDALSHEVLRDRAQAMGCRIGKRLQHLLERRHAISLRVDVLLADLRRVEQFPNARRPELWRQPREQALRLLALLVE